MGILFRLLQVIFISLIVGIFTISCTNKDSGSSDGKNDPSSETPPSSEEPPTEEGKLDTLCGGTFLYNFTTESKEESEDEAGEEEVTEEENDDESEEVEKPTLESYINKCHSEGRLYFVSKGCNSGCSLVNESWCSEEHFSEMFSESKVAEINGYLNDGYTVDVCFKSADGVRTGVSLLKINDGQYKQQFFYKIKTSK